MFGIVTEMQCVCSVEPNVRDTGALPWSSDRTHPTNTHTYTTPLEVTYRWRAPRLTDGEPTVLDKEGDFLIVAVLRSEIESYRARPAEVSSHSRVHKRRRAQRCDWPGARLIINAMRKQCTKAMDEPATPSCRREATLIGGH